MTSRFLLFSASAGSGKTFSLAVQYITLVVARVGEREFAHTLAVTFTNKATAEMKQRILEQLYGIGRGLPQSEGYLRKVQEELRSRHALRLADEEVRRRCALALKAILHDYSRFTVSTIDAFFQSVLRNLAHELGLNARLQVELGDRQVVEMAVENLVGRIHHNDQTLLPWLRTYIEEQMREGKRWDVRRQLKQMGAQLFTEVYLKRALQPENQPFTPENVKAFRQSLLDERQRLLEDCRRAAGGFRRVMEEAGLDYDDLSHANLIRNLVECLHGGLLDKGRLKANYSDTLAKKAADGLLFFPAKERKAPGLQGVGQALAAAMQTMGEAHTRCNRALTTLSLTLQNLLPVGLLGLIDEEVKRINHESNRFALAHTPILLRQMIGEEDAPFVFEKTGTRYRNIMIDEFQDTSALQWENFRVLLLNNLAQGGLGMVVGDVKQSIYRWRNGDWHILHALSRHGLPGFETDLRPLTDNYRSRGNVIRFNNLFFPLAARRLDALNPQAPFALGDLYADVEQGISPRKVQGGSVRIRIHLPQKGEPLDWEAEMLADLGEQIRHLHDDLGIPYREMALLIRKKRYIDPLIAHFAQALPEVRLVSDEAFLLRYSVAVRCIIHALTVLAEPRPERINPVPLRCLMKHYQQDVLGRELPPEAWCCGPSARLLPPAFTERIGLLRSMPLYELCEELYRCLQLARIPGQDAYVLAFLDELAAFLRDNPSDIPTFLAYWDESMSQKAIPSGEVDGIRILTVHKSKGLEFHTVLMPYCEWEIEKDRADGTLWLQAPTPPANAMGSLPIATVRDLGRSDYAPAYSEEHDNRRADELNALYVAFTRAGHNLLVWGQEKGLLSPAAGDPAPKETTAETVADLLAACLPLEDGLYTLGEAQPYEQLTQGSATADNRISPTPTVQPIRMCSYEGKVEFRQSRPAAEFVHLGGDEPEEQDERQLSYIEKGKLLHYIFSQIRTARDIDRVAREMQERGILGGRAQQGEVVSLARRGLRQPEVQDWFSGRYEVFNECSILTLEDGKTVKRRPDRVMRSPERIVVVDFKFGKPQAEHREQVAQYRAILQDMHPGLPVEGYLWYVYRNLVERV